MIFKLTRFKNKYRVSSTRLKNWDYASKGYYFITICTKNRRYFLGNIIDGKMRSTKIGKMVEQCWQEIPNHFPFVSLDEYVVMPNHIHGILVINKVETQHFASLRQNKKQNQFGPQSCNLGSIIRGFKIGVKKFTHQYNIVFHWQSRYYDHIIRNQQSLAKIRQYIINNLVNWDEDRNNLKNI